MAMSEMEQIGYEAGMQDMHDYVIKTIKNAIDNPALDVIPSKMALQVLMASLTLAAEEQASQGATWDRRTPSYILSLGTVEDLSMSLNCSPLGASHKSDQKSSLRTRNYDPQKSFPRLLDIVGGLM